MIIGAGLALSVACFAAFGTCIWIPILGWGLLIPFGFGFFLGLGILAIGIIITALIKNLTFTCNDCGAIQKINSKKYKELAKQSM